MIVRAVAAALLGALAVSGCGGNDQPTASTTTPTPTVTPAPTPTPGMSVQQVASKVAVLRATNQRLVNDLEQKCDVSKWTDSLIEAEALACSLVVQRAPLEGQIAVKTLTIANPPSEVAALLDETRK
jgi:PBP1b-binding outer membrane lipoprotein LpoB